MGLQLNTNGFYENIRENEYEARFNVHGEISITINASSVEEAKAKAEAMMGDDDFGVDVDEVTEVSLGHVWKTRPMFLVWREGRKMQVSRIEDGDAPREPDELGF